MHHVNLQFCKWCRLREMHVHQVVAHCLHRSTCESETKKSNRSVS